MPPSTSPTIPVLTLKRKQMLNTLISVAMLPTLSISVAHMHRHTRIRELSLFIPFGFCVCVCFCIVELRKWMTQSDSRACFGMRVCSKRFCACRRCACDSVMQYDCTYKSYLFLCLLFVVHTHMHTKLPDHLSVNWKQWAENFKLKIIYATARIWHVRYSKQIHICSYVLVHFSQTVIRLFSRSPSIVCFSMNERMWEFWISFTILLFLLVFFPSLSFAVFDLPHVPLRLWLCLALSQYVVVTSKIY